MTYTIIMPRSVVEKALEDLEMTINYVQSPTRREDMRDSIEALRAALEQHQVEFGSYSWDRAESLMLEAAAELRKLRGIVQRLIRERAINREGSLRDTAQIAELESQRNELLEALQGYMAGIEAMGWNTDKARSAIAKAEGANND